MGTIRGLEGGTGRGLFEEKRVGNRRYRVVSGVGGSFLVGLTSCSSDISAQAKNFSDHPKRNNLGFLLDVNLRLRCKCEVYKLLQSHCHRHLTSLEFHVTCDLTFHVSLKLYRS